MVESTATTPEAKLGQKIEKLSVSIGALAKDGRNQHSKYDYISNEQMVTALRNKCGEHGISIIPSVEQYDEKYFDGVDSYGKPRTTTRSIVTMAFKIIDLETGHVEFATFVGAEQDTGGKSMQQAITQCTKYFYFKLFNVTSHDEKDGDAETKPIQKEPTPAPMEQQKPVEIKTLSAEQFKLAMESDAKGIKATLDYIENGKIKATSNQINKLKIQLEKL